MSSSYAWLYSPQACNNNRIIITHTIAHTHTHTHTHTSTQTNHGQK